MMSMSTAKALPRGSQGNEVSPDLLVLPELVTEFKIQLLLPIVFMHVNVEIKKVRSSLPF